MAVLPYSTVLSPNTTLGILGGGQLGRMFCHAAQSLGYQVLVLEPSEQSPAAKVVEMALNASYDDEAALSQMLNQTSAITTEFENVPAQSLKYLSLNARVTPSAAAVAVVQDRIAEKAFICSQGIPVAPYAEIRAIEDIEKADEGLFPAILKVARLGYDGKGQVRVKTKAEAVEAFQAFDQVPCVLESMLALKKEVSVVMARALDGTSATFPMGVNTHIDGILSSSVVGIEAIDPKIEQQAQEMAVTLAKGLNYAGVMCVEFFILEDDRLVVNEIAPRPHNSGHYTMNACLSSQFEQQVRVLAGLPLGSTDLLAPTIMLNILGDSWFTQGDTPQEPDWSSVVALPGVHLHLYGKTQARQGRKMGHVNIVNKDPEKVLYYAREVSRLLHLGAKI